MHCTKISAEFEFGGHSPWVRTHKNVALGYDVGKISTGCLVGQEVAYGTYPSYLMPSLAAFANTLMNLTVYSQELEPIGYQSVKMASY